MIIFNIYFILNRSKKKAEKKIVAKDKNVDSNSLINKDSLYAKFSQRDNISNRDKGKTLNIKSKGF